MADPDKDLAKELEDLQDTARELNPEEDLTWANTDADHGVTDYD